MLTALMHPMHDGYNLKTEQLNKVYGGWTTLLDRVYGEPLPIDYRIDTVGQ